MKTLCLNLDLRFDDWEQNILPLWHKIGVQPESFIGGGGTCRLAHNRVNVNEFPPVYSNSIRYPAWHKRVNAYNAWLSHRMMLEYAQRSNESFVMFLEDDSVPTDNFVELLNSCQEWFSQNIVDMIYLGHYSLGEQYYTPTSNPNVYKMLGGDSGGGFHGVILSQKAIFLLLAMLPIGPFDWISQRYIHPYHNCYAIRPCIVNQQSGFSHVEGGYLEK